MKAFVAEVLLPSSERSLDPDRVARVAAETIKQIVAGTSGPAEGLAVLRIAARLIREIMTKEGVSADSQKVVLNISSDIAESIHAIMVEGDQVPMWMSRGGES